MKIAIVGGGITGCLSALSLHDQGHDVSVYEAAEVLGGIHRDLLVGEEVYFQNCQYLNVGSDAIAIAKKLPGLKLVEFPHRYGSVNDFFGQAIRHDNFAQVVVPGKPKFQFTDSTFLNLHERLSAYTPEVSLELLGWARRFGDPLDLEVSNCHHMQLGRIYYPDALDYVVAEKQRSATADDLLGVPRNCFEPPLPVQEAALPVKGYNDFFERVEAEFQRRGIAVNLRAPVVPLMAEGQLSFQTRREPIKADITVWCANPTALAHAVLGVRLDTPVINAFNLVGKIEGDQPRDPVYYQAFCKDMPFTRIFSYDLNGPKVTVEGFLEADADIEQLQSAAELLMTRLGWTCRMIDPAFMRQKRYVLLTLRDKQLLDQLSVLLEQNSVIPGGWQYYGRDAKIASIQASFQRVVNK
ncbi:NAD(P)-binding protein [Pseudomonas sichuanensis]|uniref:NAD(P)-binding protein n=1 Tax=Pseudomonas TaxID=286 RepID=UPI0036ED1024